MKLHTLFNLISYPSIDLRSPQEFKKGTIPNSINIPILNDDEYRQVGTVYKLEGKKSAIDLGHNFVSGKVRHTRIKSWINYINNNENCFIYCYRGGLRSQIAFAWISQNGLYPHVLKGGYKKYRNSVINLHERYENYEGEWIILGGYTGSGKTRLLENFEYSINLESIANHRGSAFGKTVLPQPSQVNFESLVTQEYLKRNHNTILLEDESRLIGKTKLPGQWYDKMQISDLVVLDTEIEQRSLNIFNEYVRDPIDMGINAMELCKDYLGALKKIKKRLGGNHYDTIKTILNNAFINSDKMLHLKWIKTLLAKYYDKMYDYKLNIRKENIIFRGNENDCKIFLMNLKNNIK